MEIFLFNKNGLKALTGKTLQRFLSGDDEKVFLVNGQMDEIYIIDDPVLIPKFEVIGTVYPEDIATRIMLSIVNPGRYGK